MQIARKPDVPAETLSLRAGWLKRFSCINEQKDAGQTRAQVPHNLQIAFGQAIESLRSRRAQALRAQPRDAVLAPPSDGPETWSRPGSVRGDELGN